MSFFPTSLRAGGPYGFRLVERAYSSERPEAASCRDIVPLYRTTAGPTSLRGVGPYGPYGPEAEFHTLCQLTILSNLAGFF
jgi:hypothetical protein